MSDPTPDTETAKTLVASHWNGRADAFDDESHHGIHSEEQYDRWVAVLEDWIDGPTKTVLDVGCGTGVLAGLVSDLGHEVCGLDVAPAMLETARAKALGGARPVEFVRGDAERLPIASDSVDLVTERHLLWTLPSPTAAIEEWQRVLEPGGQVLLLEGHWEHDEPWEEYEAMHDSLPLYDGRPAEALCARLATEGLQDLSVQALADPVLWGREPRHDYYLVSGAVQ